VDRVLEPPAAVVGHLTAGGTIANLHTRVEQLAKPR
jgi:hypothetical protein